MRNAFLLAFCLVARPACAVDLAQAIPDNCQQVALVVTQDWSSTTGTLRRFVRHGVHEPWEASGAPLPVLVGKHGLAWGIGLHTPIRDGASRKAEGDLCAPAGVFTLGPVFGKAPLLQMSGLRMPYESILPTTEAVDDPTSRFYNRLVDRTQIAQPDWHTSEHMWKVADYELGVIVGHNPERRPGAGSCIFLHLWTTDRRGTSGCTALHRADLLELVRWLDATKHPVLVQLPESTARESLRGF
jgi:L,D-peptidoglycan transpeptidase YkuD (ErfK/YbiS/YcfS/YnhG family)